MIPILVVLFFCFVLFCFERRRRNVAKKNCIYRELRHERVSLGSLDLIHDTPHLCTCFRVDGIKAMSRDISWGKQNFPIRVDAVELVSIKRDDYLIFMQNV